MKPFGFNVVSENREEGVPVATAGQIMVDIQNLLTDIGKCMLRTEMSLQNSIPDSLADKFTLRIGGSSDKGVGSKVSDGSEELFEEALGMLFKTLTFFGQGRVGIWMEDKFPDPFERINIAKDLVALNDHLSGTVLIFGPASDKREFRRLDREKLLQYVRNGAERCRVIGKVSADPRFKGHWTFSNSAYQATISPSKMMPKETLDNAAKSGIVAVLGNISKSVDGRVVSVNNAEECIEHSTIAFRRMISSKRDVRLSATLYADIGYAADRKLWVMSYKPLNIIVSKPSWDECVIAFHEEFILQYEIYTEESNTFEGEEKKAQALLMTFVPPKI